jgi:hypothetical protein
MPLATELTILTERSGLADIYAISGSFDTLD